MTWTEFTHGLRHVAQRGTTQGLSAHVIQSMTGLEMIAGNEAQGGGVVLTDNGRMWYQRTVVDRENERLLEGYAEVLASAFGMDGRGSR